MNDKKSEDSGKDEVKQEKAKKEIYHRIRKGVIIDEPPSVVDTQPPPITKPGKPEPKNGEEK